MESTASKHDIEAICNGEHRDPFSVLGPHFVDDNLLSIRMFWPFAKEVHIFLEDERVYYEMKKVDGRGFFEALLKNFSDVPKYHFLVCQMGNNIREFHDPYSFPPIITDFDRYLFGEGTHFRSYDKLGAHLLEVSGIFGVHFALWAPNAKRVSVVGNFNYWDGRCHPMRFHPSVGIWEIFIPELSEGEIYKYQIISDFSPIPIEKADPYGFFAEVRPKSASVVYNIDRYKWGDIDWMEKRKEFQSLSSPISIYEVHLGSWKRKRDGGFLNYREICEMLLDYVKDLGFTHIELLPITEHPLDESWGYQTVGYFAPTSRFGTPSDFMYFVDTMHRGGIGVIIDWVPAHFAKDGHGLGLFDGTHLYEHADPKKGVHPDWDTYIFNYGRNEVRNFLISSALFWLEKYHIDGIRIDAVASMLYLDYSRKEGEWIPNRYGGNENLEAIDFLKRLNEIVHIKHKNIITIAEESTAWPMVTRPTYMGGLGFDFKWNMGWMHDTLLYMSKDPIFRKYHQNNITFSIWYAFSENFILPFSHDEVVYGKKSMISKMPGDLWQKFANLRLLYAYMFAHPGKKLLFMGGEFGQWDEWDHKSELQWHLLKQEPHKLLKDYVKDLNRLYKEQKSMHELDFEEKGFEWIDFHDAENSVISFIRRAKDSKDFLIFIFNFTPVPRKDYKIGVPEPGIYREIFNSDRKDYFGSGILNVEDIVAKPNPYHMRPYSIHLTLPPLCAVVLKKLQDR